MGSIAASLDIADLIKEAVTTTVNGTTHRLDRIVEDFGIQYAWTRTSTRDIASLVFVVQGSLDGTNFVTLASETADATELTNRTGLFFITGKPVAYLRVNVTTITFSGSGTVTLNIKVAKY